MEYFESCGPTKIGLGTVLPRELSSTLALVFATKISCILQATPLIILSTMYNYQGMYDILKLFSGATI